MKRRETGFSLVELMVGVVVGLIGLLVIYQTLSVWDSHNRTTVSGGDAQVSGSLAMFSLERSIKLAGMGIGLALTPVMGCPVTGTDTVAGKPVDFSMYPVQIKTGASGAPDEIDVLAGSSAFFVSAEPFNVSTPTTKKLLHRDGFRSGDVAIVAGNDMGAPASATCHLVQISDNTAVDNATISHAAGALVADPAVPVPTVNTSRYNEPAGTGTVFSSGTMYNLGPTPTLLQWKIDKRVLTSADYLQQDIAPKQVADGVINMKAEYGVDLNGDTIVSSTSAEWITTAPTDWTQVRAIRVALLVRSSQFEKPDATPTGSPVTPTAPFWTHGDGSTEPFVMTNVDGTADANVLKDPNNWRYYRYRVYEKVIPLRNMIWGTM